MYNYLPFVEQHGPIMHSELRLIEPVVEDTRMWVIF